MNQIFLWFDFYHFNRKSINCFNVFKFFELFNVICQIMTSVQMLSTEGFGLNGIGD